MRKRFLRILFGFILLIFLGSGISIRGGSLKGLNQQQINGVLMDVSDFQVNQENYSSTFDQTKPRVVVFKDKSFLIVWQDERNGDWDVYAQKFDSSGVVIGTNFEIPEETDFSDQLDPDVARLEDSSFIVIWVEADEHNIYAQRFNPDLSPNGSPIQVNDNQMPTPDLTPALATLPDGGFVVTWQDTRVGINIYARRFDSAGDPSDSSFKVNDGASALPESPSVALDTSGVFVIVWNDSRDGDKDIYFQRYDSAGSSAGGNTIANTDSLTEVQYRPRVTFGKSKDFMITWIDLRYGNEDIYSRLFSWDGEIKDSIGKVNSDTTDLQIDSDVVADTNGSFFIAWADYRKALPGMYVQKYNPDGHRLGSNNILSDSLGEVEMTSFSINESGDYVLCWRDSKNLNFDIFAQQVSSEVIVKNSNFKANNDQTGAMQKLPKVATDVNGGMVVVWEDQRRGNLKDASDIFVSRFNYIGGIIFGDLIVNDTTELVSRKLPDAAVTPLGNSVVVWQDTRGGQQDIYGQRIDRNGNLQGSNFKVNRFGGLYFNTNPSCAVDRFGKFAVVWSGVESGVRNIYFQLFDSNGDTIGSSLKVNDDGQAVEHDHPKVAMDWSGNFVVAWHDQRDGLNRIFLQRYNSAGVKIDTNFQLQQDIVNPVEQEFDLDVNDAGIFVLVWIESRSSQAVYAQIYDASGYPQGNNILATDDPLSLPQGPKVSVDNDTFFIVTWTDHRDGNPNIYYQKFYHDGTPVNSNMIIHNPENSLQMSSDNGVSVISNGVSVSYLYTAWMDNRASGHGFDIYANIIKYKEEVGVEEEFVENFVSQFHLFQNYPNPFNPVTKISYALPTNCKVMLTVYNLLGQKVKVLVDEYQAAGVRSAGWDGKDSKGNEVVSGVYFYRIQAVEFTDTRKMILIK